MIKQWRFLLFWLITLILLLLFAYFSGYSQFSKAKEPKAGNFTSAVLEAPGIADWKDYAVISKLAYCESNWKINAVGDSGKAFGILQFWQRTFFDYGKKYKILPWDLEYQETLNRIFEPETQIAIAKAMLKNEKNALSHWKICSK